MSYTIIYDKQFLKVPDGRIVPYMLSGSNNVTEYNYNGREVRARSWAILYYYTQRKVLVDPDEFMKYVEAKVEKDIVHYAKLYDATEEYTRQHFGSAIGVALRSANSSVTAQQFINWFKNGIKNAMLVEEFIENISGMAYSASVREEEGEVYFDEDCSFKAGYKRLETSEDFIKLQDCLDKKGNNVSWLYIRAVDDQYWIDKHLKKLRHKEKKQKAPPENSNVYYVFKDDGGYYLYKYTRNGYKVTPYSDAGKRYYTLKEAEIYLKQLRSRHAFNAHKWEIEKIEKESK